MKRFTQLVDGEGVDIPLGEVWKLRCCDCGLVHDIVIVMEDGELGMALRRNKRATAQMRRHKRKAVEAPACTGTL